MTGQELGCALQAGAWPIVLIVNNASYGTIRMHQERTYPGRVSFTDIVNPDFVALAAAYGTHAERVTRTADFPAAFARALASPTGAVLELVIDTEILTPRQTLSAMRAAALEDEHARLPPHPDHRRRRQPRQPPAPAASPRSPTACGSSMRRTSARPRRTRSSCAATSPTAPPRSRRPATATPSCTSPATRASRPSTRSSPTPSRPRYHIFEGARLPRRPPRRLRQLDPRRRLPPGRGGARHPRHAPPRHLLRPDQDLHREPRQPLLGQVRHRERDAPHLLLPRGAGRPAHALVLALLRRLRAPRRGGADWRRGSASR